MKILELDQRSDGQWLYRVFEIFDDQPVLRVNWQFGSFDEKETIKQAEDRFGKCDKIIILDWI